jgi:sporulation protein YlmC with PRC-barrel domain
MGVYGPHGKLLGMKSLVANRLYDTAGNPVGKLEEIVLDVRTGCVRHVVVAVGGVLGIGRRRFAVPWSALTPDADNRRCKIDVAQMRLTAVRVPDGDAWLQRMGATRAVGTGD